MPRGRPPKNRTKEEAVSARREQVRKNVQAFRERKRLQQRSVEDDAPKTLEEDRVIDKAEHVSVAKEDEAIDGSDHTSDAEINNVENSVIIPDVRQSLATWTRLSPEISHPRLSRQQFVSNCVVAFKPDSNLNTGPHWTETLPEIVNQDSTLDFSIQAICLMQLGNVTSQRWLLEAGSNYYGQALRTLTRRLPTDKDIREEVFMAMMALSMCELFQGTDENSQGWLIHYKAAFRYLKQLSQAKNGWVPNNQPVFHFLETLCVFDALGSRRSCYFSTSDAWSRSLDRWGGDYYGPLLGMMTSVPFLLEAHDKLLNSHGPGTPFLLSRSELVKECLRLEDRFQEWHRHTSSRLENFTFDIISSDASQGDSSLIFPTLFIARLHKLYWSALILLLDTTASLLRSLHPVSTDDESSLDLSKNNDPTTNNNNNNNNNNNKLPSTTQFQLQTILSKSQSHALHILHSTSYCLNPDNGVVGKSMVLLPLWIARNHFHDTPGSETEERQCNNILTALGRQDLNFGLPLSPHVDDHNHDVVRGGGGGVEVRGTGTGTVDHVTTDEGDLLTGVHWRLGGMASFDRGRKALANLGAYCL